jgi:hypothetical protein
MHIHNKSQGCDECAKLEGTTSGGFCRVALQFGSRYQQDGKHGAVIGSAGSRLHANVAAVTFRNFFSHP